MTVKDALAQLADRLDGRVATDVEIELLQTSLPSRLVPEWLLEAIREHKLIGSYFCLDEQSDPSGLGVDMKWLTPEQMLSEAIEYEPGMSIWPLGFMPIGECEKGSGDPYFLDLREVDSTDPAVFRVYHDMARTGAYPSEGVAMVSPRLSKFLLEALET